MFDLDLADKPVNVNEGEWVGNLPDLPGVRLRVRSNSFKQFDTEHGALIRSMGKNFRNEINKAPYQEGLGRLLAKYILLDWENAVKRDGVSQPYDKELATDLLTRVDERGIGKLFREAVGYASQTVADRHRGLVDEIAGE